MPAAIEDAPAPRMTLADMDGPGAPPDDYVQPPSKGAAAPAAEKPAESKSVVAEPPIAPLKPDDEPETPEPDPDAPPPKREPGEPEPTLSDSMADPAETAKAEADAKKAKEKEDADKATAAAEKAKTGEVTPPADRDADLNVAPGAHTHPKTRKVITEFQTKAKAARDERDAVIAERESLKKERDELTAKLKAAPLPKETEEEIKTLRERVRELDITQDPIIQAKYDKRISANNDGIVAILKNNAYGAKVVDGKLVENPAALTKLVADGITAKTVYPLIVQLRKAAEKFSTDGNDDAALQAMQDADNLSDMLRENSRIAQEKTKEIESWKGDHAKRQQERQTVTQRQQEEQSKAFRQHTDSILNADLEALKKDFAYLNRPPEPLATDVPATVKAKQAASAEFDAAAKAVEAAVKQLSPEGITPDKLPELVGRVNANAVQAYVIKLQVLPRLKAELAAARKERDEYKAEVDKVRDAGKLSRLQSGASSEPGFTGKPEPKSLEDAFQPPGS